MGDLSEDLERCLCDCSCDVTRAQQAKSSCQEGRVREAKRVLLGERQRLLDEMHATQRGIDAIDHMLHRVSCECVPECQHMPATLGTGPAQLDTEAAVVREAASVMTACAYPEAVPKEAPHAACATDSGLHG